MGFLDDFLFGGVDDANKANQKRLDEILAQYGKLGSKNPRSGFGRMGALLDEGQDVLNQRVSVVKKGGQRALAELGEVGRRGYEAIGESFDQESAAVDESFARRGLYNSTAATSAQAGTSVRKARSLRELSESLAALRANQVTANTDAQSRAMADLAQFLGVRSDREMALLISRLRTIEGVQDVAEPGFLSAIGGGEGIGALIGAL